MSRPDLSLSTRSRVKRHPERGHYDRESVEAVLDAAFFAHAAFVDGGQPFCIPLLHARVGDSVCVHGSTASRALNVLSAGGPACLTVTVIDGLVLARSAFQHSANYRSVVVLGAFRRVEREEERAAAFEAFVEKLIPGRWAEVRWPNAKEMKTTQILELPLAEASVKIRSGPPTDDGSADAELDTWAGVVPIAQAFGEPEPSPGLREAIPLDESVKRLLGR